MRALLQERVTNRRGVRNFVRAIATESEGQWHVRRAGEQGSAMLKTMVQSNALLVIPEAVARLEPGDLATVQLLDFPEVDEGQGGRAGV